MILENSRNDVQTIGEVQENQVGIDLKNLDHIITLLSSNLYSNPEASFLRETVCNGIDSHIEAGTKEPVIVSFIEDNNYQNFISVRDYGTGLSPERFKEVYLNVGSSTKRQSNDYIGAFGIGKFSALSCADMAHITSYYNGTAYYYLMMKNAGKINIDKISETPTDEPNGVEVKIAVDSFYSYIHSIKYLWFMEQVYIHSNLPNSYAEYVTQYNNRKINYHKTFATGYCEKAGYNECNVLLGKVLYPCKLNTVFPDLTKTYRNFDDVLRDKIVLTFNIGELDVTPNREELLYSPKTIKAVKQKIDDFVQEIQELASTTNINYDSLSEVYNIYNKGAGIVVDGNFISLNHTDIKTTVLYKGDPICYDSQRFKKVAEFFGTKIADSKFIVSIYEYGKFVSKTYRQHRYNAPTINNLFFDNSGNAANIKFVLLPETKGAKGNIFKEYVEEHYSGDYVVFLEKPNLSLTNIKNHITHGYGALGSFKVTDDATNTVTDIHSSLWVIRELLSCFKNYEVLDLASQEYLDFKKQHSQKTKATKTTKLSNNIRFTFERDVNGYTGHCDTNSLITANDEIQSTVRYWRTYDDNKITYTIIYTYKDDPYISLFKSLYKNLIHDKYILVYIGKTNLKTVEGVLSNWINIRDFLTYKSKPFRQLLTLNQFGIKLGEFDSNTRDMMNDIAPYLPLNVSAQIQQVCNLIYHTYNSSCFTDEQKEILNIFAKNFIRNKESFDLEIVEACNTYRKYAKMLAPFKGLYNLSGRATSLFAYLLMKRSIIRLNGEHYIEIKNCLKNENNLKQPSTNSST